PEEAGLLHPEQVLEEALLQEKQLPVGVVLHGLLATLEDDHRPGRDVLAAQPLPQAPPRLRVHGHGHREGARPHRETRFTLAHEGHCRPGLPPFAIYVLTHAFMGIYLEGMGQALMRRLEQARPFAGAVEEAAVNLLLAASWLDDRTEKALASLGITHRQYNVLRILR